MKLKKLFNITLCYFSFHFFIDLLVIGLNFLAKYSIILNNSINEYTNMFDNIVFDSRSFIFVCIISPIFEEILFRGIITYILSYLTDNLMITIIGSSALFGLAHLNLFQGIITFLFGIFYSIVSIFFGIEYSIFLHILNNILATANMGQFEIAFHFLCLIILVRKILSYLK